VTVLRWALRGKHSSDLDRGMSRGDCLYKRLRVEETSLQHLRDRGLCVEFGGRWNRSIDKDEGNKLDDLEETTCKK